MLVTAVEFRGKQMSVVIDLIGNNLVEWHFEGFTPEEHMNLDITPEEENNIDAQILKKEIK